jgi:predicted Zn-dependent protease
LHIIEKDEINAFALPDGHLVVYSGLILNVDSPEELSGVLSHEIAHIELNHVMKKLVKEVGLSVLISMTTGNGGSKTIHETAKMLSGSAYDRQLEREADNKAVDYLSGANIDPEALADFLYKLSDDGDEVSNYLSWISTHPDSKERAKEIIEISKNRDRNNRPVLSSKTWNELKVKIKNVSGKS